MSTRSTTHFCWPGETKPTAIIYRHPDGYPEGAGADILDFLDQCGKLKDSRFGDPSYLAAKYVVFLANIFNYAYDANFNQVRPPSRLEFISVGVVMEDPGDIEYRYVITCKDRQTIPQVDCYEITGSDGEEATKVEGWRELAETARKQRTVAAG